MSLKNRKSESAILADLATCGFGPVTVDDFLGGQVRLIQLKAGYRAGQDAVLLAASIPAAAGEAALDLGCGTGVISLCLARRCEGVSVTGVEVQAHFLGLGKENIELNDLADRVRLVQGSISDQLDGLEAESFDHVFTNPPYLDDAEAISPAYEDKKIAYVRVGTTLADWVEAALGYVKPKGTVSFIFRADHVDQLIQHLSSRAGDLVIFPLWPREGEEAKRVIIQGRKGLAGGTTFAPGICLHGTNERYSRDAERVLREGKPLVLSPAPSH